MELQTQLKSLADKINQLKDKIETEESTKHAFVLPFINLLGYDTFNPTEVVPEFIADLGLKKVEKVLIHCNQGISRSPSIGLLYLAVKGIIKNENYNIAKEDFIKIYPKYEPSGIKEFLEINWSNYFK